jgi:DNA-directed RNA polymerase subunit RPC12/RpoP
MAMLVVVIEMMKDDADDDDCDSRIVMKMKTTGGQRATI